jgi:hypothetical protein
MEKTNLVNVLRSRQILGASIFVGALILSSFSISTAPQVLANSAACSLDPSNLIANGSMAASSPDNGVANYWTKFVLSGPPIFEHRTDYEDHDGNGTQYIWADNHATPDGRFDAGIYQTVTGLTPGTYYRYKLGFALAGYDPGDTVFHYNDFMGRQIGVDPLGGTNACASSVIWNPVGWNGGLAMSDPNWTMSFSATTNRATVYVRAINANTMTWTRDKVIFDTVCMSALDPQPTPTTAPSGPSVGNLTYFPLVGRSPYANCPAVSLPSGRTVARLYDSPADRGFSRERLYVGVLWGPRDTTSIW